MKKRIPVLFTGFYLTVVSAAFSQPGSLDLTFDGDGIVLADIDNDYTNAIALQSDGKLVIAGYSYVGSDIDFSLVRLNADGTQDNTFDTDGELTADFGGFEQFASSVAIQTDGKIVAAGTTHNGLNNDIMLMRFNADGTLDNSFDGDGIKIIDIGISNDFGRAVAIQADGKIIVAGTTDDNPSVDFAVLRMNSDGTADNTFDTDGLVLTDIDGYDDYARAITIQADGKIIVAGNGYTGVDSDFVAARYTTNGTLDNSFNFDGKLFTDFSGVDDVGNAVAVHSDGSIVTSGYSHNGIDNDYAVARYIGDGTPDVTFDSDGRVVTDIGGYEDQSFGCALFNDGKIIVTGSGSDMGPNAITLVCYNTDGSLETFFDADGKIITYVMNDTYSTGVVIQPDGKIVAAGYGYGFAGSDFVIARYNGPDCNINTGVTTVDLTLTANAAGLTYQWVDCNNGYAIIPFETNQTFTAASAGTYAVIITDGMCTDTSACFTVDNCNINVGVTQTGFTLTADAAGLVYQWVDCNNGYAMIPFQSGQSYTADASGSYAVIITDGPCSDTSACFVLDDAGFSETTSFLTRIFPNPTNGETVVQLKNPDTGISILVTDITGKIIYSETNLNGTSFTLSLSSQPAGIYILELTDGENTERLKIVKQ